MKRAVVTGSDLADHLRSLSCRLIVPQGIRFDVERLTHVEDAGPGTLSWHRGGELPHGFNGDVLVARTGIKADGDAPLVAYHDNPRMVLRRIITEFGFGGGDPPLIIRGPRCRIHPSAVLGADGQGYDKAGERRIPFPHAGGLRIGADVDVGPCATIMRGSIGDTVIGEDSKLGNGVNIGHDVRIGRGSFVIAGALIAGWVRIGVGAKIWQGANIKNGVSIGDGAQVGMGSVVIRDVPSGEVWAGNPARRIG